MARHYCLRCGHDEGAHVGRELACPGRSPQTHHSRARGTAQVTGLDGPHTSELVTYQQMRAGRISGDPQVYADRVAKDAEHAEIRRRRAREIMRRREAQARADRTPLEAPQTMARVLELQRQRGLIR